MLKRSRQIRLVLLGGLSTSLTGCDPQSSSHNTLSTDAVYTNNYYIPGAGYYHAPFRSWHSLPYNHYDPQGRRYYFGGQWGDAPFQSITNLSNPTDQAVASAQAVRTDRPSVHRSGFGNSYGHRGYFS